MQVRRAALERRRRMAVGAIAGLVAAGALAVVGLRSKVPLPPSIDTTGLDSAVVSAVEQARTALARTPRSDAAWGRLGLVLVAHHLDSEARACFIQAETLDPLNPRWPYMQAMLSSLEHPATTIVKLERTVDLCPPRVDAPRLRLAEALLAAGRLEQADARFREVLDHDRDNPRARLGLARVELQNDRLAEAGSHLTSALGDRRTRKAAYMLLAQIEQRRGNHAEAAMARETAAGLPADEAWPDPYLDEIARFKTGWQAALERAQALMKSGDLAAAAAELRQAATDYPAVPYVCLSLGRALVDIGDIDGAERAFRTAVRLQEDSAEANYHLGVVVLAQKKSAEAVALLQRAVALKPDFAQAHFMLARSRLLEGDDRGAIDSLRTAVRCKPEYGDAHRALGELLYEAGQREEALTCLRTAADLNPDDAGLRQLLEQAKEEQQRTSPTPSASEVVR